eukprot:COSAG02_NODE_215_length_28614_cov_43.077047_8_plen_82_part_00
MTAVMKNAYSLLSEGCIIKACTSLQKHWAKAMELQVKIDWYSFIHLGSLVLMDQLSLAGCRAGAICFSTWSIGEKSGKTHA